MLTNMLPFGRLGNRLFLAAHVLAFGLEYRVTTRNYGFLPYSKEFPWLDGNACLECPWKSTGDIANARFDYGAAWLREHLPGAIRFRYWGQDDFHFDEQSPSNLLQPLGEGREVFLRAWLFRGFQALERHRDTICDIFRPRQEVSDRVGGFIESVRQESDFVVGVHLRWEDYRGTKYFLDQPAFRLRLESLAAANPDRKIRFVLFSNEGLTSSGWGSCPVVLSPFRSPLEDMISLSRCDLILAPPSTFSGWSSFFGEVPLITLTQENSEPRLAEARVIRG